jgi:putative transposase
LLSWIVAQGIGTALIEPGKPWQNGVAESFNGTFRDECLSLEWFRSQARGTSSLGGGSRGAGANQIHCGIVISSSR